MPSSSSESTKPIEKRVIHAAKGPATLPQFTQGTKACFHFVTKLTDDEGTVIDDSRKWSKPMEIIFGKQFKLEAWEMCIQTMTVGEVASFRVKKQYACNYPAVAKTLRDNYDSRGKHKSHGHMCGMMALQAHGGLGYDDLNQLMKEPQDLEFVLELLSVEQPDEYSKEAWQMSAEEKMDTVPHLREEGNRLYKEGKVGEAADQYGKAIGMLEQLMLREKPQEEEWLALRDVKIPLLLNFSQCKLSQGEFYPVIEHCTEVLEAHPDNVKALFRRAKAHVGAWNPQEAKEDFSKVMKLDPSLVTACKKELKGIEDMEKQKNAEDREKLRKMF